MNTKLLQVTTAQNVTIPLVFEQNTSLPIVSLELIFKNSGAIFDEFLSISAVFSEILNEGSKEQKKEDFYQILEDKAIRFYAYATKENIIFSLYCFATDLKVGINAIKQVLNAPNFSTKTISSVKSRLIAKLENKKKNNDYLAVNLLNKTLFSGNNFAKTFLGTKESIVRVRYEGLKQKQKSSFTQNKLIMAISGFIDEKAAKNLLLDLSKTLSVAPIESVKPFKISHNKQIKFLKQDVNQTFIHFGAEFLKDTNEHLVLLASNILGGGGFGSRLTEEVRVKRGLAYSVWAGINQARFVSFFSGYMQTSVKNQSLAIELLQTTIKNFIEKGATQNELKNAQEFLLGSEPLKLEKTNQRLKRILKNVYLEKTINHDKEVLEKLKKTSLKELNEFLSSHTEMLDLSFGIVSSCDKLEKEC